MRLSCTWGHKHVVMRGVDMGLVAGLQPGDPREIGPYRTLGRLGSGGMGHVFLSMSAGGRPIAVKVIREELADDPQFRTRFTDEVAAARKVGGLFTAFVVDAELDGPMPWLASSDANRPASRAISPYVLARRRFPW